MILSKQQRPVSYFFSVKIGKYLLQSTLLVTAIGVFLLPKTAFMASITPDKIIELTNKERAKVQAGILAPSPKLEQAALNKAKAILAAQTFDHTIGGAKFSSWVRDTGYQYSIVGENLAIDFITSEGVLRAWLASPSHKDNLLNGEYTETGVAVLEGDFEGQPTIVVAQIFAAPLAAVAPIQKEALKKDRLKQPAKKRVMGETEIFFSPGAPAAYLKNVLAIKNTAVLAVSIVSFQLSALLLALLVFYMRYLYLAARLILVRQPRQAALF